MFSQQQGGFLRLGLPVFNSEQVMKTDDRMLLRRIKSQLQIIRQDLTLVDYRILHGTINKLWMAFYWR